MASGQVLEKLRNFYSKAEVEVKKWEATQDRLYSLLSTITNILNRLPTLQAAQNYGELQNIPGYQEKLLRKQLSILEDFFGKAQFVLRDMATSVHALEKIYRNAERTMQQDKRLTPAARAATAGPVPSINQCLDGLQEIWKMHSEELLLQQALTAEVSYEKKPEELQEVLQAVKTKANIQSQKVKDMLHVLAATAEVRI